ncbi:MAG TPA: multicopper oxidase family protein [Gemmatimonadales bacterium]|nr:multicopper oxidase family protein [Gemmatimonadales bacterium]
MRTAASLLLVLAATAGSVVAQGRPCDPPTPLGPSRDLYCIELVAAPGMGGASGHVELAWSPSLFTVTVTADGRSRFVPIAYLAGLPPATALAGVGSAQYVAWAASPQMDAVARLGPVGNGRTTLPPIDLEKFVILITAERGAWGREPRGRVVLRGQSPSTRLFPPDLLEFSLGAAEPGAPTHHHGSGASDTLGWTMVPMPPALQMLPAEMALRPRVAPLLPADTLSTPRPVARPRETIRLADGDTLPLEAGLVRRRLGGRSYTMYAFNGQTPGPLLEVTRGSGVVVRFTNHLPESTTVHWHGIRLENRFDGVVTPADPAVPPGGTFVYHVRFPDAGIYWYHPHVREDVQQALGLDGNILVRPATGSGYGPVDGEEVLLLSDLLVGESGLVPFGRESPTHALMGRFGNVFLVNGEPGYQLAVRRGDVVRFVLTNASSTRTLNLSFPGTRMKVVASDAGAFERERWAESVVLAPAERYVVHVRFERAGRVAFVNRVQGLDHLFGRFFPEVDTLGLIDVTPGRPRGSDDRGRGFRALGRDTAVARALAPYRRFLDRPPDKALVLTLRTSGLPFVTERLMQLDSIYFAPVEWSGTMPMMNWASSAREVRWVLRDPATGRENMDIDWRFRRGEPVKLRLVNERRSFHGMQHPIHLHGQRFLVLAVNGVPMDDLAWKDTVLVPAGAVVDILVDPANPGRWMLHCHIAEHLGSGMMLQFTVE